MFSPDSQGQGVRAQVALSVFVNTAHAAVCRCYVLFLFVVLQLPEPCVSDYRTHSSVSVKTRQSV